VSYAKNDLMMDMYGELLTNYYIPTPDAEHVGQKLVTQKAYSEDVWRLTYNGAAEHDDILVSQDDLFIIGQHHEGAEDYVTIGELLANEGVEYALAVVLARADVISYDEANAFLSYDEEEDGSESKPLVNPLEGWSIEPFNFDEKV
jgi:hypothetical protein